MSTDELVYEISRLKARIDQLESVAFGAPETYVEGWSAAARMVGVTEPTCKARWRAQEFPPPCRTEVIVRKEGNSHMKPTWKRSDLVAYAEGKWAKK